MTINFGGNVYDDAGSAVSGASVKLLETGTTTQEGSTATTDSDGRWDFTEADQDRYDVEITKGSSIRRILWNDQISLKEIDVRNNTGATTPAATFTNLQNAVANQVAVFSGANSTKADGDEIYLSFKLADSAGNIDEFARITAEATDVTSGSEDGQMRFGVIVAGTLTDVFTINSTTGGATSISYEVDSFTIKGEEGGAGVLYLMADQGDDAGDEWKVNIADGGVLTFGNDIASAGTYVTFLTVTPHATTASSTVAIVGDATVGDDLSLTSDSSVFNMGAGNDFTITHDGTTGATLAGNPITITASGASTWSTSSGALTITSAAALNLSPAGGSVILLDGTISIDAGVVTGATAITSATIDATTDFTIGSTVITDDSIVMTPSTSDTVTVAAATNGVLNITTVDNAAAAANLNFVVDGAVDVDAAGAINLDSGSGIITFEDSGTEVLRLTEGNSGDVTVKLVTNGKDLVFTDNGDATNMKILDAAAGINVPGEVQTTGIGYTDGDNSMTIADGGKVTFAAGFAVGSDAAGDVLYHNGTSYVRLAKGSDDEVLTLASGVPSWASSSTGDITGVTAGVGLSGGGSSGAVTLTLDLSELSTVTPADGDFFSTLDSDGANEQKTTTTALATLLAGTVTSTGIAASSSVLSLDIANMTASTSIADADLIVIDDGAGGTLRKMTRANFIESAALDAINIDGGAIDGAVIGANTAAAGTFAAIAGTTGTFSGVVDVTDATDSSDATGDTGALRTEGGASIAKKLYVGTDLDVDGTAELDNITIGGAQGSDGEVLTSTGSGVGWEAAGSGALTRVGGNTTEATTTSTSAVDLLSVSSLTIGVASPIMLMVSGRKTAGAADDVAMGLKLNSTILGEATTNTHAIWGSTTTNHIESGLVWIMIPPRNSAYPRAILGLREAYAADATGVTGPVNVTRDNDIPTATITDVVIRGITDNSSITLAADELHIYTLASS
jgi:hypothetical protein